jgi:hypothetical protein
LLAKENLVRQHEVMDEYNEPELGTRLLPGVDLALWLRIFALMALAAVAAAIVVATT